MEQVALLKTVVQHGMGDQTKRELLLLLESRDCQTVGIRKKYCGNGRLAEIESIRLERRKAQRDQVAREKQLTATAESTLTQQIRNTEDLVAASLTGRGIP